MTAMTCQVSWSSSVCAQRGLFPGALKDQVRTMGGRPGLLPSQVMGGCRAAAIDVERRDTQGPGAPGASQELQEVAGCLAEEGGLNRGSAIADITCCMRGLAAPSPSCTPRTNGCYTFHPVYVTSLKIQISRENSMK